MAAITSLSNCFELPIPCDRKSGTATPKRRSIFFIDAVSTGSSDTIDINSVVDQNIAAIEGILYDTVGAEPSAGTAGIDIAGTTITTTGGAVTHLMGLVVRWK